MLLMPYLLYNAALHRTIRTIRLGRDNYPDLIILVVSANSKYILVHMVELQLYLISMHFQLPT